MINLIIDCNYLCYVNRFALSQGMTYRGGRTEIMYGFLKNILEMSSNFQVTGHYFCWDSRESLRKKLFPQYKENRRKEDRTEEEKEADRIAFMQFDLLRKKILPQMGFRSIYHIDGYESDDLIAFLVLNIKQGKNIVVSSDEDLFQLLNHCSLYNFTKKQMTSRRIFMAEYKVMPGQWPMVKSIGGCRSDNVPGIAGVGEKTAIKYINGKLKKGTKALEAIEDDKKKEDGIIARNLPLVRLPFKGIPELKTHAGSDFYKKQFEAVFQEYGFSSFLKDEMWSKWVKTFKLR